MPRIRLLMVLSVGALTVLLTAPSALAQDANDTETYVGEAPYVSEAPAEVRGEQVERDAPTTTTAPSAAEPTEQARGPLAVTGNALTWLMAAGAALVGGAYLARRRLLRVER